jgi:hypothetical protein
VNCKVRRIFNALVLVSAILCIVMIALWVRSISSFRVIWGQSDVMLLIVHGDTGRWAINKDRDQPKTEEARWNWLMRNADRSAKALGCELLHGREPSYGFTYSILIARYSSLALMSAVLPVIWIIRNARCRGRRAQALCPVCNYDMRATPDRCPECGTEAVTLPPAQIR